MAPPVRNAGARREDMEVVVGWKGHEHQVRPLLAELRPGQGRAGAGVMLWE